MLTGETMHASASIVAPRPARVEIVVPVYNEEADLESSICRLRSYLDAEFPFESVVTIADNASTDATLEIATRLSCQLSGVRVLHLDAKGRGRALRAAWSRSDAEVVAYMDVDLSTDLAALLPLVAPLLSGHSDVAIGSRLARGSRVVRGPKREVISRIYNAILRLVLHNRFTDAQCGFKAMRAEDARSLLPAVLDNEWFFDTELLVLAERNGLRIHEVPVDWSDDPDSRVDIVKTAVADLKGVWRLVRSFWSGGADLGELAHRRRSGEFFELARFASVGMASTIAYFGLFLLLRPYLDRYLANFVALLACLLANLATQFRLSFWQRRGISPQLLVAWTWATLVISLACTDLGLFVAQLAAPRSILVQLTGLLVGSAWAGFVRFVTLRAVSFRRELESRMRHPSSSAAAHYSLAPTPALTPEPGALTR